MAYDISPGYCRQRAAECLTNNPPDHNGALSWAVLAISAELAGATGTERSVAEATVAFLAQSTAQTFAMMQLAAEEYARAQRTDRTGTESD